MQRSTLPQDGGGTAATASTPAPQTAAEGGVPARDPAWSSSHTINLRLSFPFGFGRYYLTIVGGRERRSTARLADERRKHPLMTLGNLLFLSCCGSVLGLAVLALLNFLTVALLGAE